MDAQFDRITRLQASLRRRRVDGLLVSQPDNRRYLSGYTAPDHGIQESAGLLLIPAKGRPFLLTDARFTLQAEAEAPLFQIEVYARGLLPLLERLVDRLGLTSLAFESDYLLYSTFQHLAGMAEKRGLKLAAQSGLIEAMREVKSAEELELLRASTRLNEKVFQSVYATIEPGMTEREIALALELTMREMGAEGPSFPTIVAFGTNAARPHAVPTDRELQAGDLVLIDMGLVLRGYCSDLSRTFVAGRPDPTYIDRHRVVRAAMQAGIGDCFGHSLGHGVGLAVHEAPRLSRANRKKLRAGMVVTVEPGIYLPDWGGIRLENMVVVGEDGCELLNHDTTGLDL